MVEGKEGKKVKIVKKGKMKKESIIFLCCILAFPILHKAIFYFGTNIRSVMLTFQTYDANTKSYEFVGFKNIIDFISDIGNSIVVKTAMLNTLKLYALETFVSIPISLLCSYFVVKKVPFAGFFKVLFFLPGIMSSVVMVLMFMYFVEYAIPEIWMNLFSVELPLLLQKEPYAFRMMMVFSLWFGFASGIIMYVGAMTKTSDGIEDAAQIDGATIMQEFFHITLPCIYPTLCVFLVTSFVTIFSGSGAVFTFYADNAPQSVYTMGYFLFTKVIGTNGSPELYPYAAAGGFLITIIAAPLTFLLKFLLEKFGPSED